MSKYNHSSRFYTMSYYIPEFLTSLVFTLLVLIIFMGYRYYEVQTLFVDLLETRIQDMGSRTTASILIGVVITLFTLAIMVHSQRLYQSNPWLVRAGLSVVGMFINLAFWKPWQAASDQFGAWGVTIILSAIDWTLPYLFEILWRDILQREAPKTYPCDKCGQEFDTYQGRNSHSCPEKPRRSIKKPSQKVTSTNTNK